MTPLQLAVKWFLRLIYIFCVYFSIFPINSVRLICKRIQNLLLNIWNRIVLSRLKKYLQSSCLEETIHSSAIVSSIFPSL